MKAFILLAIFSLTLVSASPNPRDSYKNTQLGGTFDISSDDLSNVDAADDDNNNILLPYDPVEPKRSVLRGQIVQDNAADANKIKPGSYLNLEREQTNNGNQNKGPNVREVMSSSSNSQPNIDQIRDIALNSREVRLVGPQQKEVEMKDDMATKMVVALENLQKEAQEVWGQVNEKLDKGWTDLKRSEVWGQVNEKLDKGWTDLKTMVEGVVAKAKKDSN